MDDRFKKDCKDIKDMGKWLIKFYITFCEKINPASEEYQELKKSAAEKYSI
jgi:hypothetical protein